jgi:molybdopterin molybdotransferase
MISLDEALARLIGLANPLGEELAPLPDTIGRWTAAPVKAKRTQPSQALSAMDGYAVAHADWPGPFTVSGESAAGAPYDGGLAAGQAVRIFTGAVIPEGADTVIIQENIDRDGDLAKPKPDDTIAIGQHVRPAGSDFSAGQVLIDVGEPMTPANIALASSGGHGTVLVRRRPTVEILATGNELVPSGEPVGAGQIPESNAIMVATLLQDFRCGVSSPGIIPDDSEAIKAAIRASTADILVTIGGASVGEHDLVKPALEACGAELDFWKVAMRPGKPLLAGKQGGRLILGLPGNPVSAFVTAFLFLRPLVAALSGATNPLPQRIPAVLFGSLPANGDRTDHIRAKRLGVSVSPIGPNDSGSLYALAHSDTLIIREPHAPKANPGDEVEVIYIA